MIKQLNSIGARWARNAFLAMSFLFLAHGAADAQRLYFEDFELGVPGLYTQNFVVNTISWSVNGGTTGTLNFPYNGNNSAGFFGQGGGSNGAATELVSPTYDLSQGGVALGFWYGLPTRFGGNSNNLAVYLSTDNGSSWILVDSIVAAAPNWTRADYKLDQFAALTSTCMIKFLGINAFGSRLGLDDIELYTVPAVDMATTRLITPLTACAIGTAEPVIVEFWNNGAAAINSFEVFYSVNSGPAVKDTFKQMLAAGATSNFLFKDSVNLSVPGNYAIDVWTGAIGDADASNDTIKGLVSNVPVLSTFPSIFDFEGGPADLGKFRTLVRSKANLNIDNAAANFGMFGLHFEGSDENPATTWPGGSSNNTTAQSAWGTYRDYHASATICVDASSVTAAGIQLSFDLKQQSSVANGNLYNWFRVLVNGVQISQDFHPMSENSDPWVKHTFNLSQFAGSSFEITLQSSCKYSAVSGVGGGDQVYVDNLFLSTNPNRDVSVTEIVRPINKCGQSTAEPVEVTIENTGFGPISTFEIGYQLNNMAPVIETFSDILISGQSGTYLMSDSIDISAIGTYTLATWVETTGDINPTNDTLRFGLQTVGNMGVPYAMSFDSGAVHLDSIIIVSGNEANYSLDNTQATNGTMSLRFEGSDANPSVSWPGGTAGNTTPQDAWNTYTDYQNSANFCIDATAASGGLELSFDLKQWSSQANAFLYNWFRVLVDGTQVSLDYNPQSANSDPWQQVSLNLTQYVGTEFTITFQTSAKYSANAGVGQGDLTWVDNISLKQNNLTDGELTGFNFLSSGCDLSATTPVSVNITNNGFTTLTGFDIYMSVDGAAAIKETVSGSIPGGLTGNHGFLAFADLSAPGDHTVEVWIDVPGDVDLSNDTTTIALTNYQAVATPISQDFEMAGAITTIKTVSNIHSQIMMAAGVGSKSSMGVVLTGSDTTNASGWTGTANNTPNFNAWFDNSSYHSSFSYCVDASALTFGDPLELIFDLRQTFSDGEDYSWFRVNVNGFQISQDYQPTTANSDPFARYVIDLSTYSGSSFEIEFQAACRNSDAASTSGVGDKAILDNIIIREPLQWDASPVSISVPSTSCAFTANEQVDVSIRNLGLSTIQALNLYLVVDGSTPTMESIAMQILPDSVLDYTFTATANMGAIGTHNITVYTDLVNDGDRVNDTLSAIFETKVIVSSFPYTEDFENGAGLFNIVAGPEGQAGIDADAANNSNGGILFEGIGVNTTQTSGLTWNAQTTFQDIISTDLNLRNSTATVCVDATNESSLELLFDLRQFTTFASNYSWFWVLVDGVPVVDVNGDSLHLEDPNNSWRRMHYDLTPYVGKQLNITFQGFVKYERGIAGGGQNFPDGDAVHLDNMLFRNYLEDDAKASALLSPINKCGLGTAEDVTLAIENLGTQAISNVVVGYSINGAAPAIETYTGTIAPGQSANHTFTIKANLSATGIYNIAVWTQLAMDGDVTNDSVFLTIQNATIAMFPAIEDLETFIEGNDATGYENGWTTNPSATNGEFRWNVNTGGTPSNNTGPNNDHSPTGSGVYLFTEASSGVQGSRAEVLSPCYNLSSLIAPKLVFWYHMFGGGMGTLYISVDDGGVRTVLDSIVGQQNQGSNSAWLRRAIDLRNFAGKTVRIVFTGQKGGSNIGDMAIDDIGVEDAPLTDLTVVRLVEPFIGCYAAAERVVVEIQNAGSGVIDFSQNNASVNVTVTGPSVRGLSATLNTGFFAPGATQLVVLDTAFDMSTAGTYTFNGNVSITGDGDPLNDGMPTEQRTQEAQGNAQQLVDFTGFDGGNLAALFSDWSEATGQALPGGNASAWNVTQAGQTTFFGDENAKTTIFGTGIDAWILSPKFVPGIYDSLTFELALTKYLAGNGSVETGTLGSDDKLELLITTDCGLSWQVLDVYDASDNLDSVFTTLTFPMLPYAGQQIRLAWRASAGSVDDGLVNDIHIDNINIFRPRGTVSGFNLLTPGDSSYVRVEGDPNGSIQFDWESAFSSLGASDTTTYEYKIGQIVGSNFLVFASRPSNSNARDTIIDFSKNTLASLLKSTGANIGDTVEFAWDVEASSISGIDTVTANKRFVIYLIRGIMTGFENPELSTEMSVYPNPANALVTITFEQSGNLATELEIFNIMGASILQKDLGELASGRIELSTNELSNGVYFVVLNSDAGRRVRRLVIQH